MARFLARRLVFALVLITYVVTSLLGDNGWNSVLVMFCITATSVVALTSSDVRPHWIHLAIYLSLAGLALAVIAAISGDETWLAVETAAAESMAAAGLVPADAARDIRNKGAFDIARIEEIEAVTHHDVIAFTTAVAEKVGPSARWLHFGLTSSDVVDTAQALQMREACALIIKDIAGLMEAVRLRAEEHRRTPMIGRTHGVHAEPMTFGVKLARPEALVLAICGDGTYLFSQPSTVHWMASRYESPFLHVVFNNGGWRAPRQAGINASGHSAPDPVGRARARRGVVIAERNDRQLLSQPADDRTPLSSLVWPQQRDRGNPHARGVAER